LKNKNSFLVFFPLNSFQAWETKSNSLHGFDFFCKKNQILKTKSKFFQLQLSIVEVGKSSFEMIIKKVRPFWSKERYNKTFFYFKNKSIAERINYLRRSSP
jgi:hypothetical protein